MIEAPKGTKGAYFAPIKKGEIINPNSPYTGQKYNHEQEFLLKKNKLKIIKIDSKPQKDGLIHIRLRIVE